ncbi:transposase [Conexibacter woesei]|uniref:transposase n=1 Tax=Conexibacter woesei TaxID=191495 RepID=UPI0003F9F9B4|nr:transposase [Conexibacter woesei]
MTADADSAAAELPRALRLLSAALSPDDQLLFTQLSRMSVRDLEAVSKAYKFAGYDVPVVTKSVGSRHLQRIGDLLLDELGRDLSDLDLAAIVIDGTPVGEHTMVWALGVTSDGLKIPLGIGSGPTETKEVVRALLDDLGARGLHAPDALWLTDGGPGLMRAIEEYTNGLGVNQRCVVHNARKVIERHLTVADRVALGRHLVDDPDESHRVAAKRREKLAAIRAAQAADPEDKSLVDEERKLLREIGEVGVRAGLYAAWDEPGLAVAEARLVGEAKWLEQMGHGSASTSIRGAMEGTLTLQRLGVAGDEKLRKLMRTTNVIESVHQLVSVVGERPNRWTDVDMRRRFVVLAIARAELGWRPLAERARLEQLTRAVLQSRHPAVELEAGGAYGPDVDPDALVVARAALDPAVYAVGEGGERLDQMVGELAQWADRNGKPLVFAPGALDRAPDPEARRRVLADLGFAVGEGGALTRAPAGPPDHAVARDAHAVRARDPESALALLHDAAGGDARLVAVVAERALAHVPDMVDLGVEELEREAAEGLRTAHRDVASAQERIAAWWRDGGHDAAARHMALRPDALAGGRGQVLDARQAAWIAGRAAVRREELARAAVPEERLEAYRRESAAALAPVDAVVGDLDRAARAVAATHVLDAHARIEAATREVEAARGADGADAAEPVVLAAEETTPVQRRRSALGDRRADALARGSGALGGLLRDLDDDVVVALRDGAGDPWAGFSAGDARKLRGLEERDRGALLEDYTGALRTRTELDGQARGGDGGKAVRAAAERGAHAADAEAQRLWERLDGVDAEAAELRTKPGSLERLMTERPGVALHDAAGAEVSRRALERGPAIEPGEIGALAQGRETAGAAVEAAADLGAGL